MVANRKIVQKKTPQSFERGVFIGGKEPLDKQSVCIAVYRYYVVNILSCPHSCPLAGLMGQPNNLYLSLR